MPNALSYAVQAIFFAIVLYFAVYVLLELRILLISRRVERRGWDKLNPLLAADGGGGVPAVSVLLPVCNESAVVERLIDGVARLAYPLEKLEILVLDDSSDQTSELARARVAVWQSKGLDIRYLQRSNREGYKAGNLIYGLREARGDFFAIFDADFVPPPDFLCRAMPCFRDSVLGFLQTGIGYENRDSSFLTRFQAMEMEHQQYVTVGLSSEGDMALLSGSSCIWRKACVDAVGGWSAATVAEDADLSYRAQFGNWKYAYLPEVVSMSILPESMSAFRVQRERWGRGLIHSAFKHFRQMLGQRMPFLKRLHAVSVMFSSCLLASIYVLILLTLPLNYLPAESSAVFSWGSGGFYLIAGVWALDNAFGARKGGGVKAPRGVVASLWDTLRYVAMFLPMSWYYFVGGIRACFGVHGEFNRTPKHREAQRAGTPLINRYLIAGEMLTLGYALLGSALAILERNYWLLPLTITVCLGFGMVVFWSLRDWRACWLLGHRNAKDE